MYFSFFLIPALWVVDIFLFNLLELIYNWKLFEYVQFCNEDTMSQKAHGTSDAPVQKDLRWSVSRDTADRICNFNRHCTTRHTHRSPH